MIVSPAVTLLDLRTLVDVKELQRIQDEFAADTGLAMITVDATGRPVTEASRFTGLCRLLRRDPAIRALCHGCDAHGGLQSAIEGRPVVYRCHAGLVDLSVSIMWGTQYLGAVLAGQVMLAEGQEQLQQVVASSGVLEVPEAAPLLKQVGVVELGKLQAAANEIAALVSSRLGSPVGQAEFTMPEGATAQPQAVLGAEEVAHNVQRGDIAANLGLLGEFLDQLLPRWSQKVAPKELGAYEDMLIGIAAASGERYGRDISQEVIRHRGRRRGPMNRYECQVYCERLLIRLHDLLEPVCLGEERNLTRLLGEIEKNPTAFLTLGQAAAYVRWSQSHFARKFKEATGSSFITYVTVKRLERAKFVLRHTDKPVLRIAAELEFTPPNYFSRAFKKHVGLTPSQYRREYATQAA
ncbi:MAG: PocR ligand-binding domain-containing protein [Propionibacteriaceae bacterium]|nr:PocR ligand-binding domain-containing protein [Propionibacteriaceae bacterium]